MMFSLVVVTGGSVVWCVLVFVLLSYVGHMVDALVPGADEGRVRLRYAWGSCQQSCDPRISEWGNPAPVMWCYPALNV